MRRGEHIKKAVRGNKSKVIRRRRELMVRGVLRISVYVVMSNIKKME